MRGLLVRRCFATTLAQGEFRANVVSASNFDLNATVSQPVVSLESGSEVSSVDLRQSVFARAPIRADLLQRVVVWQLAKRRSGTAKSKNLAEVSGSTKKGAPQKGRGMARVGAKRAPQFRGGGRAFPKRPRSYDFTLPHHIRKLGLAHALSSKFHAGKLALISEEDALSGKTRELKQMCDKLGWESVLFVTGNQIPEGLSRAVFNLPSAHVLSERGINVYDVLRRDHLAMSVEALAYIQDELLKDI